VAPERILKWGAPVRSESEGRRKFFWGHVPPLFWFYTCTSTVTRSDERFRDGQYSLVSLLFAVLLLTVPPVPSHL